MYEVIKNAMRLALYLYHETEVKSEKFFFLFSVIANPLAHGRTNQSRSRT